MARITYGIKATSAPARRADAIGLNVDVQQYGAMPVDGRVIALGGWTGIANGSTPFNKKWMVYKVEGGVPAPTELLAVSAPATVATTYSGVNTGADVQASVASVKPGSAGSRPNGVTDAALLVRKGLLYAIGTMDDSPTGVGLAAHGVAGQANTALKRRYRALPGFTPPDPLAFTSSDAVSFFLALYAVVEENRLPTTTVVSPAAGSIGGNVAPNLTLRFTDQDRTDGYGDYPTRVAVTVTRINPDGSTVLHGAHTYDAGEFVAGANPAFGTLPVDVVVPWAPLPAMALGNTYAITAAFSDEHGSAGPTYGLSGSTYTHQIATSAAGVVATTSPLGKVSALNGLTFAGTYSHPSGTAAASVQARLLRRDATGAYAVLVTSAVIALSPNVANGGTISRTHAQLGFPDLEWGKDYATEWQITDALGVVGVWSGRADFATNRRPNAPTGLAPAGGTSYTTPPLASFDLTDADDTPASAGGTLVADLEVAGPYAINGTFNVDATGWATTNTAGVTGTGARQTDTPQAGAGYYQHAITANTLAAAGAEAMRTLGTAQPVVAGYAYTLSGQRRTALATLAPRLGIQWLNAANAVLSETLEAVPALVVNTWTPGSVTATAPPGATQAKPILQTWQTAGNPVSINSFDEVVLGSGVKVIRSATKTATGNRWQYQLLDPADLAVKGVHSLRARGRDAVTTGDWSAPASFNYVVGPAVTVTAPTASQVLANNRPTITWVIGGGATQNRYRVLVFRAADGVLVYDSLWTTSTTARSLTVPANLLINQGSYLARVQVEDPGALVGTSPDVAFTVSYPPLAVPTGFAYVADAAYMDDEGSVLRFSWMPIDTDPAQLPVVELWRAYGSDPAIKIAEFADPLVAGYIDPFPPSLTVATYSLRQRSVISGQTRYSGWATLTVQIVLASLVLASVDDPLSDRVVMRFWSSRSETANQNQSWQLPAGASDYVEVPAPFRGRDFSITWRILDSQTATGIDALRYKRRLDAMFDNVLAPILCLRDFQGNRVFCRFNGALSYTYNNDGLVPLDATIGLRRVAYKEALP